MDLNASGRTHSSASVLLSLKNLESLHDDAASDDCVGRGDRRDDVSRHRLDVEATLLRDAENLEDTKGCFDRI